MDIHNLPEGTTPEDVAKAHAKDMEIQRKYGVDITGTGSMRLATRFFASRMRQTQRQQSVCIAKLTG